MNLKLTLSIIALIANLNQVQGQGLKNNLNLTIGLGHIARQDLVFSPFIHSDFTPLNIGLEYSRNAAFYQNLKLRFASFNPMLTSPYNYFIHGESKLATQHIFRIIDLDYTFGKEIKKTKRCTTMAGAMLASDVQILNYEYGRSSAFGYYANFGLGGFFIKEYVLTEKSRILGRFALPLINWLSRSPYLVNDDEFIENISSHSNAKIFFAFIGDGKFVTVNKFQTCELEAKYTYQLNRRWDVGIRYLLEFIHSKEPRSLLSYRNSVFVSTNFKF